MIKETQYLFQKEHRLDLLKHFRRQVRYVEKHIVFFIRAPALFLKRTSLFSPNVPCKTLCPCMNVLLHLNPLILLRNVVRDSCSFFPFLVLTCGEVSVAMSYEYLLYFSGIF